MTKKYRKRYRKKSKINFLVYAIALMVLVGVLFNVADILSSLIVGKGSVFYNNSFETSSKTFYAISCDNFKSEDDAQNLAQEVVAKGGAGYVYHSGEYYVFLSMYASQLDARSVVEKLKQEDIDATIVNINIPKLKLTLSQKDRYVIKLVEEFLSLFEFLYDLSITYDSGNLDYDHCITKINERQTQLNYVSEYNPTTKEGIILKEKIVKIQTYLKNLTKTQKQGYLFNSKIKQTYFDVVFDYIALCKDIG